MEDGHTKNVVVMTKEIGYLRKPSSAMSLIKLRYRKYPKVYELMKNRPGWFRRKMRLERMFVFAGNRKEKLLYD